ncbi:alpha/beta-hydrolase [Meredithblackwellia eburnea MCA 4105]
MSKAPKVTLQLVKGKPSTLTLLQALNVLYFLLPRIFVTVPIHIVWNYILNRWRSPLVQLIGRPWYSDFVCQLVRYFMARVTPAQARILFNRTRSYKIQLLKPEFKGYTDWVSYVEVNGTAGRWIAPPGTRREDDEVVFYYVHGGGFVMDTGGDAQVWLLTLAKEMNLRRRVQFSVFALDYRLAPEYKYPSQLIEVLAGYHHLVNTEKISEERICFGGDSAGGNLTAAFLLHLARPNPSIKVPASLGKTPKRPGSAILISPWVKLLSNNPSRKANEKYDFIESDSSQSAVYHYIGAGKPAGVSWRPTTFFYPAARPPPSNLLVKRRASTRDEPGLGLLNSPYVNPSVCEDPTWWREACPAQGRTMVIWGGKEIFNDDVVEFVNTLEAAGIEPFKLCKQYGSHDWIMYDYSIPGISVTNALGDDREFNWGAEAMCDFFQDVDLKHRKAQWDVISAANKEKKKKADAAKAEARAQLEAKQESNRSAEKEKPESDVGDSVVIVDGTK